MNEIEDPRAEAPRLSPDTRYGTDIHRAVVAEMAGRATIGYDGAVRIARAVATVVDTELRAKVERETRHCEALSARVEREVRRSEAAEAESARLASVVARWIEAFATDEPEHYVIDDSTQDTYGVDIERAGCICGEWSWDSNDSDGVTREFKAHVVGALASVAPETLAEYEDRVARKHVAQITKPVAPDTATPGEAGCRGEGETCLTHGGGWIFNDDGTADVCESADLYPAASSADDKAGE